MKSTYDKGHILPWKVKLVIIGISKIVTLKIDS